MAVIYVTTKSSLVKNTIGTMFMTHIGKLTTQHYPHLPLQTPQNWFKTPQNWFKTPHKHIPGGDS